MTTTYFEAGLETHPLSGFAQVKTILVEPLLIVAVCAFWIAALPFVPVWLVCVKVWDVLVAMKSGNAARPNPLFLRRSRASEGQPALHSRHPVRIGHA